MNPLRLGVLVSGSGTNLQAVIDAIEAGEIDARIQVVVSDKEAARGLDRARTHGIEAVFLDRSAYPSPREYNAALRDVLLARDVELVVMAGYMRLLGTEVLEAFDNRVVNLHPSLLPSFAGANGIREAFEHGVKVTGVTVHLANERFDEGAIIAQEPVMIDPDDTLESLEAKIHAAEHRLLPKVLGWFADGRVLVDGRRVVVR